MIKKITISILCLFVSACATVQSDPVDPYEKFNRQAYQLNECLDKYILLPFATMHYTLLPAPVAGSITNFFSNLNAIPTAINDLLQGNLSYFAADSWRLVINSTFGIFGIFDIANLIGIPPHTTDFGITLQVWGIVKNPPYFVIPFYGPSTVSDAMALPVDYYLTVYPYLHSRWTRDILLGLYAVNFRANILSLNGIIQQITIDPYLFQRDAYLQHRAFMLEQSKSIFVPQEFSFKKR